MGKVTTYVLIVEDDEGFIEEVSSMLVGLPGQIECKVVRSRDEAFVALDDGFVDLVILDLKIPTTRNALDAETEHGYAVFGRIRTVAPGTPIVVLTGSSAEDFIGQLLQHQQQMDIWGEGKKTGTIVFHKKRNVADCREVLARIATAIDRLSEVELDRGVLTLTVAEDRLIRIFAKKFGGVRCVVSSLGGGLSGTRVIRLRVTDDRGVQVQHAVAKLAGLGQVREEGDRYDHYLTRLGHEATPRKLDTLEFGACNLAGIFFELADGFDENVFDVAKQARGTGSMRDS